MPGLGGWSAIAAGGALAAFVWFAPDPTSESRAAVAERWNLTSANLPIHDACRSGLSRERLTFVSKAADERVCGCLADTLGKGRDADSVRRTIAVMDSIFVARADSSRGVERQAALLESLGGATEIHAHVEIVGDAIDSCVRLSRHLTDEDRERISAEETGSYERSRIALDVAVERGHMTRAEADAHLARLADSRDRKIAELSD